jgi:hypothetical protein
MRAREILQEDYNQSLLSDLNNLLVGAKANGAKDINTEDLVNQLYGMGYAVDVNSIMTLLSQNPNILNATPESITLTPPENVSGSANGPTQDSATRVGDMAQKATKL